MNNDFPSAEEQDLVRKYVLERPLYRPSITYLKAIALIISVMSISIIIAIVIKNVLFALGFFLSQNVFYLCFFGLEFLFLLKPMAILAIRLYQHYAPEEVRRRCLLKPTCSEYAIIVIKKYGAIIGTIKIWRRLKYKCRGNVYYIDEP